jgi:hypothetical protein
MQQLLKLTVLFILLSGCNNSKTKYPYSINDFRPELRKDLEKIVEYGIAYPYETSEEDEKFNKKCSVDDLRKLMQCEHPLIRARAFIQLVKKDSANIEAILLASLNDTAIIAVDDGEWGTPMMYCADFYLDQTHGKTKIKWKKIFDTLVTKYPNLHTTFNELTITDTLPEKYYDAVKSMAVNHGGAFYMSHGNKTKTDILFALSKYKRKDDINFIKDHLRYSDLYFWLLLQNNPDTAYFSILKKYLEPLQRAKKRGGEYLQTAFWGIQSKGENFEDFLITLAKFKNKESAEMFSVILKERIFPVSAVRRLLDNEFECILYDALKTAYCDEYESLIKSLKPFADMHRKKYNYPIDQSSLSVFNGDLTTFPREYW